MVAILLIPALLSVSPIEITVPDTVEVGQVFTVTVSCSDPACRSLSCTPVLSTGLDYRGSSTSSSYTSVHTPSGSQTRQEYVLTMMIVASDVGSQQVGPLQVYAGGLGLFDLPAEPVYVAGVQGHTEALESSSEREGDKVWIEAVPQVDGRIYPGMPFEVRYYAYARVYVDDVEYWWKAPEFGTACCVDAPAYVDWDLIEYGLQRALLCVLEVTPAAPGSIYVPVMEGYITEQNRNPFMKGLEYYPVSAPVAVPVWPYPDERPVNWNGSLTDSVSVEVSPIDCYSGQGGEKYVRITVSGPGSGSMSDPPDLTVEGPARLLRGTGGEAGNKVWWDLVVDPWDEGTVVLGPDSVAWFDTVSGTFRQARVEACTLGVECLPWTPVNLEFEEEGDGGTRFWIILAAAAVSLVTVFILIRFRRRRPGAVSLPGAADSEELVTAFESALSMRLRGRRGYLETEELSELLDDRGVDSLLARRIVRFWKDTERLLTGVEPAGEAFQRLRTTALQLIEELDEALTRS
jgi:hypothetical protein